MSRNWDPSDVPSVCPLQMRSLGELLVASGRGLFLLRGLTEADTSLIARNLWETSRTTSATSRALLARLACLTAAFGDRRLRELLLQRGHALIGEALALAAVERLNQARGFNAARLALKLQAASATSPVTVPPRLADAA